ncbi:MAG: POTRA domain-containing protein, partial [Oryzomonas sp.]
MLVLIICVVQLLVAGTAWADGEKIVEVRIAGNHRIESAAILNVVSIKAGDTLNDEKTDFDIRAIYKLGHFQDVHVSTDETDKGTVLVYTVLEKPVVRDIKFEGNKELGSEKLKEALEFRQNSILSTKDIT